MGEEPYIGRIATWPVNLRNGGRFLAKGTIIEETLYTVTVEFPSGRTVRKTKGGVHVARPKMSEE